MDIQYIWAPPWDEVKRKSRPRSIKLLSALSEDDGKELDFQYRRRKKFDLATTKSSPCWCRRVFCEIKLNYTLQNLWNDIFDELSHGRTKNMAMQVSHILKASYQFSLFTWRLCSSWSIARETRYFPNPLFRLRLNEHIKCASAFTFQPTKQNRGFAQGLKALKLRKKDPQEIKIRICVHIFIKYPFANPVSHLLRNGKSHLILIAHSSWSQKWSHVAGKLNCLATEPGLQYSSFFVDEPTADE